jgi:hypothetical protein
LGKHEDGLPLPIFLVPE